MSHSDNLQEFLTFFGEELEVLQVELYHQGGGVEVDEQIIAFLKDALRVAGMAREGRCRPPILMRPRCRAISFAEAMGPLSPMERAALAGEILQGPLDSREEEQTHDH